MRKESIIGQASEAWKKHQLTMWYASILANFWTQKLCPEFYLSVCNQVVTCFKKGICLPLFSCRNLQLCKTKQKKKSKPNSNSIVSTASLGNNHSYFKFVNRFLHWWEAKKLIQMVVWKKESRLYVSSAFFLLTFFI